MAILLLLAACGEILAEPRLPTATPEFEVAVTQGIVYGQGAVTMGPSASLDLLLDLYEPVGAHVDGGLSPAAVIIHGGGFTGGTRGASSLVRIAEGLAERGHVVISIDYRVAPEGPVPSERVAPLSDVGEASEDPRGPAVIAAIDDGLTALDWLISQADELNVDPGRIGLIGGSAGAITVANMAYALDDYGIDAPDFSYVVDFWGGVIVPSPDESESPEMQLDNGEAPLFLVHGTADPTVSVARSDELSARALAERVPMEYRRIEGAGHGFDSVGVFTREIEPGVTIFDRMLDWVFIALDARDTVFIQDGIAGTWFDPNTPGQGLIVDIDPDSQFMFVGWYTFDTASAVAGGAIAGGEQRWFTAEGTYFGNRIELDVLQSRNGVFQSPMPADTNVVGTLVLEYSSCDAATASYDLPEFGLEGTFPIVRLLPDTVCRAIENGELRIP